MSTTPSTGESRARAGGAELRYVRRGLGRPVVLLHTLRTQLEYFRGLLERLERAPLEVIAVDLPGHGQSSATQVEYTAEYFSDATEQFLDVLDLDDVLMVGDSIGATIALTLAARHNPRIARVIAVNPYDYGRRGGIRRSSGLANALFTAMLWPGVGPIVARSGTRTILKRVLEGGLADPDALPPDFIDAVVRCGSLPGHARAFRSLNRQWRSWVGARRGYSAIECPVTLVYADQDWSRPDEREANSRSIPGVRTVLLERCGHFASLEQPQEIAELILSDS